MHPVKSVSTSELATVLGLLRPNQVRQVRSDELTSDEVAILNRGVVGNSFVCWVSATRENIEKLLGCRPCREGENPTVTIGGTGYIFENNKYNRPLSLTRIAPMSKSGTYAHSQANRKWGAGAGLLVFDDRGQIVSAQHSLIAALHVAILNPESLVDLSFLCFFGLPPQFRDWSDKGRARNKTQDSYGDDTLFTEGLIGAIQLERTPPGKDRITERTGLIKLRSKIASNVLNRFGGKNISKTGDKLSWPDEKAFADRFADSQELERLCVTLWESAKSPSGKQDRPFMDLFELSIVGAGLILASNRQEVIDAEIAENVVRQPDEAPEDYTERKLAYQASLLATDSPVRLDWELVNNVLKMLAESSDNAGPLATVFGDLFTKKSKDKRSDKFTSLLYSKLSIASMSAFVELVKNILAGDTTSSVWTSYRIVDEKAPTSYRCFGGLDIGYVNSRKGKDKSDE